MKEANDQTTVQQLSRIIANVSDELFLVLDFFKSPSAASGTKLKSGSVDVHGEAKVLEPSAVAFLERLSAILDLDQLQTVTIFDHFVDQMVNLAVQESIVKDKSSSTPKPTTANYETYCQSLYLTDLVQYYYSERSAKVKCLQSLLRISQDDVHPYYTVAQDFLYQWTEKVPAIPPKVLYQYAATRKYRPSPQLPAELWPMWTQQLWQEQEHLLELLFLVLVAKPFCSPPQIRDILVELNQAAVLPETLRAQISGPEERAMRDRVLVLANLVAAQLLQLPVPTSAHTIDTDAASGDSFEGRTLLQAPEVFMAIDKTLARTNVQPLLCVAWGLTWARLIQLLEVVGDTDQYQAVKEMLWWGADEDDKANLTNVGAASTLRRTSGDRFAGRDVDKRIQWISLGFKNGMMDLLEAALHSDLLATTNPNALGYRMVLKEVLMQLFTQLEVNRLPDFDRLVECTALLFYKQPELSVQFWTEDLAIPGRASLLEYVCGRFPYSFQPFLHLIVGLFTPETADYVSNLLQRLSTLTQAVLPQHQAHLTLVSGSLDQAIRESTAPIPLFPEFPGFAIPTGTQGLQLSSTGSVTLVKWQYPYIAWDLFHHLLDFVLRSDANDDTMTTIFGAPTYPVLADTLRLYHLVFAHFFGRSRDLDELAARPSHEASTAQDVLIDQLASVLAQTSQGLRAAVTKGRPLKAGHTTLKASASSPFAQTGLEGTMLEVAELCLQCLTHLSFDYASSVIAALERHGLVPTSRAQAVQAHQPTLGLGRLSGMGSSKPWIGHLVQVEARRGEYKATLAYMRLVAHLIFSTWPVNAASDTPAEVDQPSHTDILSFTLLAIHHQLYVRLPYLPCTDLQQWASLVSCVLQLYTGMFKSALSRTAPSAYHHAYQYLLEQLVTTASLAAVNWDPIWHTLTKAHAELRRLRLFALNLGLASVLEGVVQTGLAFTKVLVLTMYLPAGCSSLSAPCPGLLTLWRELNRLRDAKDVLRVLYPCWYYQASLAIPELAFSISSLLFPLAARHNLTLTLADEVVDSALLLSRLNACLQLAPAVALPVQRALLQYLRVLVRYHPSHAYVVLTGQNRPQRKVTQPGSDSEPLQLGLATTLIGWIQSDLDTLLAESPDLVYISLAILYTTVAPGTTVPPVYHALRNNADFWTAILNLVLRPLQMPRLIDQETMAEDATELNALHTPLDNEWQIYYKQVLAQRYALPLLMYALHFNLSVDSTHTMIQAQSSSHACARDALTTFQARAINELLQPSRILDLTRTFTELPYQTEINYQTQDLGVHLANQCDVHLRTYFLPLLGQLDPFVWYPTLGSEYGYNLTLLAQDLRQVTQDPMYAATVMSQLKQANHQRSLVLAEQEREAAWGTLLMSPMLWQSMHAPTTGPALAPNRPKDCLSCAITDLLVDRLCALGSVETEETVLIACNLAKVTMTMTSLCRFRASSTRSTLKALPGAVGNASCGCRPPLAVLNKLTPLLIDHLTLSPNGLTASKAYQQSCMVFRAYLCGIYSCVLTRYVAQSSASASPSTSSDADATRNQGHRDISDCVGLIQAPVCEWMKRVCALYEDDVAAHSGDTAASTSSKGAAFTNLADLGLPIDATTSVTPAMATEPNFDFVLTTASLLFHEVFRRHNNQYTLSSAVVLQQHDMYEFFAHQLSKPSSPIALQNLLLVLWSLSNTSSCVEQLVAKGLLPGLARNPMWAKLTEWCHPNAQVTNANGYNPIPSHVHPIISLVLAILTNLVHTLGQHMVVQTQVLTMLEMMAPYLDRIMTELQYAESRTTPWTLPQLATIEGIVKLVGAAATHARHWHSTLLPSLAVPILLRYVYWLCRPAQLRVEDPWLQTDLGLLPEPIRTAHKEGPGPAMATATDDSTQRPLSPLHHLCSLGAYTPLSTLVITGHDPSQRVLQNYFAIRRAGADADAESVVTSANASGTDPSTAETGQYEQAQANLSAHVLLVVRHCLLSLLQFTPTLKDVSQMDLTALDATGQLRSDSVLAIGAPGGAPTDPMELAQYLLQANHRGPMLELSMSISDSYLTLGSLLDLITQSLALFASPTKVNSVVQDASSTALTLMPKPSYQVQLFTSTSKDPPSDSGHGGKAHDTQPSGAMGGGSDRDAMPLSAQALLMEIAQFSLAYMLAQITLQFRLSTLGETAATGVYHSDDHRHAAGGFGVSSQRGYDTSRRGKFREHILPSISREIRDVLRRVQIVLDPSIKKLPKDSAAVRQRSLTDQAIADLAEFCQLMPTLLHTLGQY
ncbi:hypothetical protein H4R35_003098 [Dimargaris xerosporica]|nr:hypothetical protein H4R35_003098 [Dimargaris xerosporica]